MYIKERGGLGRRVPQDTITADEPISTTSSTSQVVPTPSPETITTTIPMPSPTLSSEPHMKQVPEIGGSEGGFIGLVVGLSIIIVISCAGVFYLLTTRQHGGRRHGRLPGVGGLRPFNRKKRKAAEEGFSQETQEAGFPSRQGTLFGYRSRGREGWIQASEGDEGDEWDSDLEMDLPMDQQQPHASGSRDRSVRPGYQSPLNDDAERRYDDPYSSSPPPLPDPLSGYQDHPTQKQNTHAEHPRQVSVDSAQTAVTQHSFSGGSKFLESL